MLQWIMTTDTGSASLTLPHDLTRDDLADLDEWWSIIRRTLRRLVRQRQQEAPPTADALGAAMASKTFYDCGCMEQGDQYFHCAAHKPQSAAGAPADAPQPEICICAAWKTDEGLIFRGHRHSDARDAAMKAFCHPSRGEDAQGFIASTGRFVDRREGRRLQEAADVESHAPGGYRGDLLFSEDLY